MELVLDFEHEYGCTLTKLRLRGKERLKQRFCMEEMRFPWVWKDKIKPIKKIDPTIIPSVPGGSFRVAKKMLISTRKCTVKQ